MHVQSFRVLVVGLALLVPTASSAAISGRVVTSQGDPVAGARVEIVATGAFHATDGHGQFVFPEVEAPAEIRIQHPRFAVLDARVEAGADAPTFSLTPKQSVFEEIVVSATREADTGFQPVTIAASSVKLEDRPSIPTSLMGLIEGLPGVAENGQGGQFQAYSIRGVAGQRVMALVAGARIVTERRAGATASFVDPLLLDRAEVVRGPFSSYYGSGAMGGLVHAVPRRYADTEVTVGYDSQGDQLFQHLGLELGGWSLGLAHRESQDTETPSGDQLFSRFDQWSAALARRWTLANQSILDLVVLPTVGRDVGKPNARFPGRTTIYPEENHLITRLRLSTTAGWRFDVWGHPNELHTLDLQAGERARVDNDAFDYGLGARRTIDTASGLHARVGLDYYGRSGVKAREETLDTETGETEVATTLDGRQDEVGLYGSVQRSLGRFTLQGGGRLSWLEQANSGAGTTSDTAFTAFAGFTVPLGRGFELAGNLGSGFRFPGLSERFFSGTTGRGEVVANQGLDPETSVSFDLGVRYFGKRLHLALYGYRNEIDDYIERIDVAPGVRTFVNLTSGTIEGLELEGFFQLSDALRLTWAGLTTRGEADGGVDLADIPAARAELGVRWQRDAWTASGRFQHRFSKDQIGPGEQDVAAADLLSAAVTYRMSNGLSWTLAGSNLLDETYLPSADDLSVPAAGRSVSLALGWRHRGS